MSNEVREGLANDTAIVEQMQLEELEAAGGDEFDAALGGSAEQDPHAGSASGSGSVSHAGWGLRSRVALFRMPRRRRRLRRLLRLSLRLLRPHEALLETLGCGRNLLDTFKEKYVQHRRQESRSFSRMRSRSEVSPLRSSIPIGRGPNPAMGEGPGPEAECNGVLTKAGDR